MYILRPYQQQAVDAGVNYFFDKSQKKPVLMILPTASGKSLILSEMARKVDAPLIIFQPTKEILMQNYNKLMDYQVQGVCIYSASMKQKNIGNITLATIGSVYKHPEYFKQFKYVLIDECDVASPKGGMYKTFIDVVGEKILGVTATAYRMSTDGWGGTILKFLTRTNPRIFSRVIHVTQTKDLSDQGYLSPTEYFQVNGFNRSEIKLNSTGADYDEPSERQYYDKTSFDQKLIKVVNRLLEIGKTRILVFVKFTKEAEALASALGDIASYVHAEMDGKERDKRTTGFRNGTIKVMCNVGIYLVGFDYPELQAMVMARPTRSLRLYYQAIGRVLRPHPSKEKAMIVDLCGNFTIFGRVEDLRVVERGGDNLWCVMSNGRQLTNVYLSEIMKD
jgi:DNA repair protein RadD